MISIFTILIFVFIGIIAGFLSGLLGVGGGLIVVPSLLFFFYLIDFPAHNAMQSAVGTSLAAMIFTAGSSAWAHYKKQGIDWGLFKFFSPGIVVGCIWGAVIAYYTPSKDLKFIFGFFVCLFGIYFLMTANSVEIKEKYSINFTFITFFGILIGFVSSSLGIGGGIMTVPALGFMGVPLRNAISTSAATGFVISIAGALSFLVVGLYSSGDQGCDFDRAKAPWLADRITVHIANIDRFATDQPRELLHGSKSNPDPCWSINQETIVGSVGYIYMPAFIFIGLGAFFTAPWGASYAYTMPLTILKYAFGIFQILIGFVMMFS